MGRGRATRENPLALIHVLPKPLFTVVELVDRVKTHYQPCTAAGMGLRAPDEHSSTAVL